MTIPSAERALLGILSDAAYSQRANDGTIANNALDSRVSANPGRAIGMQALYYHELGKILQDQGPAPSAGLHIVKPPSI